MKKAIGYIRISDKDQSNFSLDGQERYIRDFCERQNYALAEVFKDDGRSAKNFDRPDWIRLEGFIKLNKDVAFLVVVKYDRFSRNVQESLTKIQLLENKYNIVILSVMEPIALHPQSPYFFQFRMQLLLGAQTEWLVIQDRTKFGINQAHSKGRWVNRAPIGYRNTRDENDKPIIVPDEKKAPLVAKAFDLFIGGMPIEALRKWFKERGVHIAGNSTLQDFLGNPVYAGMILKKSYYDEPEKLVPGIHQAIVTETTWYKAQAVIKGNAGRSHIQYNEAVPLRGALKGVDGRLLTAGNSKSAGGKYIWYYVDSHNRKHHNANKLHEQFEAILAELTFTKAHLEYLQQTAIVQMKSGMADREKSLAAKQAQLRALVARVDKTEELYIDGNLDREAYFKWKERYVLQRSTLQAEIEELTTPVNQLWGQFSAALEKLCDLVYLFRKATIQQKHSFINIVFDSQLWYSDKCYRTSFILPIFSPKALILKEKGLLLLEQPLVKSGSFEKMCPEREHNRTIRPLLELLSQISAA